ncbi:hypothetical protein L226DRAFT_466620, partial [Lentinus tigrinus ALCF2SS1-7]|uniref:uncharacterized protein n=1 Tax=Lentinus tigrinus ALCF2SS1-7 TaxID=1328758 RepID=UPI001165CC1A
IVDSEQRGFVFLAGAPNDPTWGETVNNVASLYEDTRKKLVANGAEGRHRRGGFVADDSGYSFGQGQQRVGNLKHRACDQQVMDSLIGDHNLRRVANFASAALQNYVPEVFQEYDENMKALLEHDPTLRPNFPGNVFACATNNTGPQTVTTVHLDHLNYAFGMCAVTAFGNYDYKTSGHLILWDAKLIIEFPPGSTILFPSAILRHSNVCLRPEETRYSLTQYSAGGLFRYVRCGFRSLKAYLAAGHELTSEYEEWKDGWKKYPVFPA